MSEAFLIRDEVRPDIVAIRHVNESAFETTAEARLVDVLRDQVSFLISLVATIDDFVVGHILFSPVTLEGHPQLKLAGLAPMAVLPSHQRQGIGTALVTAGLERCREAGYDAVVVLGHRGFYPRFGFVPASRFEIRSEYDVPDEVFMIAELRPHALDGASGVIRSHPAFKDV